MLSYNEPQTGPRARVRFVTTSTWVTVLRAYADAECAQGETEWMRLTAGNLIHPTAQKKSLGMPLAEFGEHAAKEVYVEAGKPMHGLFVGTEQLGTMLHSCGVPFSYRFEEGRDYEVLFQFRPSACSVVVSSLVPGPDAVVSRVVLDRFENRGSNSCLAQFQKRRLY